MIRIKFQTRNVSTGDIMNEDANVISMKDARMELQALVSRFNATELARYGDDAQLRELVSVDTGQEGQLQHDWHKKNLGSELDKHGFIFDTWQCRGCGIRREVRTLDGVPHGGDCFPERTCRVCGKVFASAKNLGRHLRRKENNYVRKKT